MVSSPPTGPGSQPTHPFAASPSDITSGMVAGKYRCDVLLGRGGQGEVWKAWDSELSRWVALKFLKSPDGSELARFRREAQLAANLSHPNIAAIYEIGEHASAHFIAMQYVDGPTLKKLAKPRRDIVALLRDAARAVQVAHQQGVIHRDLKPENLMTDSSGRLFVMDFGLARPIQAPSDLTASGMAVGTPGFMPPEQARGQRADARSDVYSLGATLYDLVACRPPFGGATAFDVLMAVIEGEPVPPRLIDPTIEPDLETVILKCLEKDPDRRYPTASALADDLGRWLDGESIAARRASFVYRLRKSISKRRGVALALLAGLLAVAATGAIFIPRWLSAAADARRAEAAARTRAEAMDRARPHLEAGRRILEQVPVVIRNPRKTRADIRAIAEEAVVELEKALAILPDLPDAHLGLARAAIHVGDKDRALQCLAHAIDASPSFATVYLDRIRILVLDYERESHDYGLRDAPRTRLLRELILADLDRASRSSDLGERLGAEGFVAFAEGRYSDAVEKLRVYVRTAPGDAKALVTIGHALYHLRRNHEALDPLRDGVLADPRDPDARAYLAMSLSALGSWREAIEQFNVALELDPTLVLAAIDRGTACHNLGLNALEAGRLDEAETWFQRSAIDFRGALKILPDDPAALFNLGNALRSLGDAREKRGRRDDALAAWREALPFYDRATTQARHPKFFNNRGLLKQSLGDLDGAHADYSEAVAIEPGHAESWSNRASLRNSRGDPAGAIADYSEAIRTGPGLVSPYYNRGVLYHGRADAAARRNRWDDAEGDWSRALDDYAATLRLDPKHAPSHYNASSIHRARADRSQGEEADRLRRLSLASLTAAIDAKPDFVFAWVNRGILRRHLGDLAGSVADHQEAIRLQPDVAANWANLGNSHKAVADKASGADRDRALAASLVAYDKAISLASSNPEMLLTRGHLHKLMGSRAKAAADYRKALDVAPADWRLRSRVEEFLREVQD